MTIESDPKRPRASQVPLEQRVEQLSLEKPPAKVSLEQQAHKTAEEVANEGTVGSLARGRRWDLGARITVAAVALGGFLTTSGFLAQSAPEASAAPPPEARSRPRVVTVAPVERAAAERERRFFGAVRAADRAALSFTIGGRLAARPCEVGAAVQRGAVLARLDTAPLANAVAAHRAGLAELDARLALGRRNRDRDQQLYAEGVIADASRDQSASGFQSLSAAREATEVQLREARRQLAEATLVAPFAGVVVGVHLEPGEYAPPGTPVVTLSGAGGLEVELEVPESVVRSLGAGGQATIDLPLAELTGVAGRVRSVGTASPGSGLFPVVIELTDVDGVQPGMTAEVRARVTAAPGLTVPVAAVLDPSGRRPAVLAVREGLVHRVPVRVGEMIGDRVRADGELHAGDQVVVGGHTFLLDGDRVEVK